MSINISHECRRFTYTICGFVQRWRNRIADPIGVKSTNFPHFETNRHRNNFQLIAIYYIPSIMFARIRFDAEKNLVSISKIRNLSENDNFQLESLVNEYINNICVFLYFESEIFKFEISTQFLVLTLNRKIFNYT